MTSILKADTIQDTDGNNIINENSNTITIGASGDTITIPSGATISNSGTATGFGGITNSQIWLLTADTAMTGSSSFADITANISEGTSLPGYARIGDAMSVSSGVFTFPTTGIWTVEGIFNTVGAEGYAQYQIRVTTNNSTYNTAALSSEENDNQEYSMLSVKAQVDVTDTSNVKVRFHITAVTSQVTTRGNSNSNQTCMTFIRLGDT